MPDQPSDAECETVAMLLGPYHSYLHSVRIYGRKVIRNAVDRTYLDPVTLEVIWSDDKQDKHGKYDVFSLIIKEHQDDRPTRTRHTD